MFTPPKYRGYSLVELLVVSAIISTIAAMAVGHYRESVIKGCRGDAKIGLENVANAQEKFYFDHNRYASSITSLPVTAQSADGVYNLTTGLAGNSNAYVVTAIQSEDQDCLPAGDFQYRIFHTGVRQRNEGSGWIAGWN